MDTMETKDYIRIEAALSYLSEHGERQPTLADVADHVGLSEHHLQRVFTRWAGISPKRFLQFQTVEAAKSLLHDSRSVLDTTYAAGLSSGGRLHDLFITLEAMTPGEYKSGGAGLAIKLGFHESPYPLPASRRAAPPPRQCLRTSQPCRRGCVAGPPTLAPENSFRARAAKAA